MNQNLFKGIVSYPITPFDQHEKIDLRLFKILVERLVVTGSHAVAPLGSTGVLPYLTDAEKEAITLATVEQVAGRIPVLAGVSNLTTERTVHHARFAEKAGADAVMIIPMSYWKLTEDEIFRHYQTVADAISIPVMAYNNPATGGIDMSPSLLIRLLQIPNVTMIKESTGDVQRMHQLYQTFGKDVAFYNGSNPLALAAFTAGATGWCTAASNLIPDLTKALYEAVYQNNLPEAQRLYYQQAELLKFIVEKGLPRTIKAGLHLMGIDAGYLRNPLQPLSEKEIATLRTILFKTINKTD
ncbi:dihydrodipicolinate synthase family protein [Sphingobacterium spiritivorum]|uniref:dihydrodipicolinate synthase family protein n=1 Tax=Sphingobacterium spiritivorum TaxID=258 RepID=UPI003DA45EEF